MKNEPRKIGGGLAELPEDPRDFSRVAVFGAIRAQDLPRVDFMVALPLGIKDQGDSDECTAYATTAASEDQEAVILDPHFSFYATKVLILKNPEAWGADLRSACASHVKHGALEEELAPFVGNSFPRERILDPENWDEDHKALAFEHRKNSFFDVLKDSPHDTFDSIRAALWENRMKMQSVITGAKWRNTWTDAPGGVIPKEYEDHGTPHAFVIKGQKTINGELHLVAQLSNGTSIGDSGVFYFPREVVNKEFRFGCYSFEDMPRAQVENHLYYGTKVGESLLSKWAKILWRILLDNLKRS